MDEPGGLVDEVWADGDALYEVDPHVGDPAVESFYDRRFREAS